MSLNQINRSSKNVKPASSSELNSWKRGFTPQAEIWNGRMAIIGLLFFFTVLSISYLIM